VAESTSPELACGLRLGLKRTTLMSKMEKLGIEPGDVTTARAQRPVAQSAPSIAV